MMTSDPYTLTPAELTDVMDNVDQQEAVQVVLKAAFEVAQRMQVELMHKRREVFAQIAVKMGTTHQEIEALGMKLSVDSTTGTAHIKPKKAE